MRKSDQYILLPLSMLDDLADVCTAAVAFYERKADEAQTDRFRDFANAQARSFDKLFESITHQPVITVCTEAPGRPDYTEHPRKDVW